MRIDRAEFSRLVLVLASAGCERAAPEVRPVEIPSLPSPPARASQAALPSPEDSGAPRADAVEEDAEPTSEPGCSNAVGNLRACARVGPTCEGLAQECRTIGQDLRPRVAEAFAECMAAAAKRPDCRDHELGACMRAAVATACIEPGTVAKCRAVMNDCRAAGTPVKYTLAECAEVASAAKPSRRPGNWVDVDWQRMGPSAEDAACSLEYVLPYQPWGFSWK